MASLSLRNLNKIYPGKVQAVHDFSLEIADKEFIVFVGPSGCGKSTTLRMIAGLEDISSGELYIDDEYMNAAEPKDRNIAMVFQSYALYPHMTVYENIKFALKLRKTPFPVYVKQEPSERMRALLEEKKAIKKQISAVKVKAKKANLTGELREKRDALYARLYEIVDECDSLKKQKVGIDEYQIYSLKQKVKSLEARKEKCLAALEKGKAEKEEADVKVSQLEKSIATAQEKIAYLEANEVPLFRLRKPSREEMDIEINKVAEQIDLVPYLLRKPSALSGGQRQRVALGRAMVRKPKVFLMDEPLSNLDAKLRVQTRNEIKTLHRAVGATTIYVTHDQIEAMTMADRIVIMKDGYVQQIGTPHEVFNNPANQFVGGFIGSSPMNFLPARYENGCCLIVDEEKKEHRLDAEKYRCEALERFEGKAITLGIRPGNVYLAKDPEKENPSETIRVRKANVELIGTELVVHTELHGLSLIVKTKYEEDILASEFIDICFDTSKLFIFDAETGDRLA